MSWRGQVREVTLLRASEKFLTLPAFVLGIALAAGLQRLDRHAEWAVLGLGSAGAQAFLASIVAALISFVGIAYSVAALILQLASAQLSPRVIKPMTRGPLARLIMAETLFTLGYCLTLLLRSGGPRVPQLSVAVSVMLAVFTIMGFVALLDRTSRGLRPPAVVADLTEQGVRVAARRYPRPFGTLAEGAAARAPGENAPGGSRIVVHEGRAGRIQAYDRSALETIAERLGVTIAALREEGEYIYPGAALFRVEGAGAEAAGPELGDAVVLGEERSLDLEPAYAFRLLVDIGIRALSPAINDPATAVETLDGIHRLLAVLGDKALADPGASSRRVTLPEPTWERLVDLACTELRMYGVGSVPVLRRMRAMLEELIRTLPAPRAAALEQQLGLLDAAAEASSTRAEERVLARQADPLGLG